MGLGVERETLGDIALLKEGALLCSSMRTSRTMWPRIWKAAGA